MTAFEREIRAFLCVVGITKYDVFAPHYPRFFTEFERHTVSKSTMNNLYNEKYKALRQGMATKLARRLQYFLDGDATLKTPADLADRLAACGGGTISFLRFEKGRFTVSIPALITLYGRPGVEQAVHIDPEIEPQGDSDRTILAITLPTPLEAITSEQQDRLIDRLLGVITAALSRRLIERLAERLAESVGYVLVKAVTEGCTTIKIEVSRAEADQILRAFRDGQLTDAGVIAVDELHAGQQAPRSRSEERPIDPLSGDAHQQFASAWKTAAGREVLLRPWRRLRWLFSPAVRLSPLAQVIGESDQRSYSARDLLRQRWRSLLVDLSMTGVLWPLLTATLLLSTLALLRLHYPFLDIESGVATGLVLSLAGAQVCASVVSPIAVGAGATVMGWAFGLAHAFVIGEFGSTAAASPLNAAGIRHDFFVAVAGGPVGLSAPEWPKTFSPGVIAPLLAAIALSIATAGWLMAQPRVAAGEDAPIVATGGLGGWLRTHHRVSGIGAGVLAGGCIGLVYGFTQLISPAVTDLAHQTGISFMAAFATIGGVVFGVTTWLRTRSTPKGFIFGILHAFVVVALCLLLMRLPEGIPLLIALSAASAYFHATWFTAAFIVATRFGSVRSAVIATTLEGAVGFTAFVIFRMLHG